MGTLVMKWTKKEKLFPKPIDFTISLVLKEVNQQEFFEFLSVFENPISLEISERLKSIGWVKIGKDKLIFVKKVKRGELKWRKKGLK